MSAASNYESFVKAIGQTIYERRSSSAMTQGDLGKATGRNQSTIAKIEKGPLPNVGIKVVYEIAQALDMSTSELLAVAESKSSSIKKKAGADTSLKKIERMLESLPPKKRKWLENVFFELVRGASE